MDKNNLSNLLLKALEGLTVEQFRQCLDTDVNLADLIRTRWGVYLDAYKLILAFSPESRSLLASIDNPFVFKLLYDNRRDLYNILAAHPKGWAWLTKSLESVKRL
jgi:hypothetical protein